MFDPFWREKKQEKASEQPLGRSWESEQQSKTWSTLAFPGPDARFNGAELCQCDIERRKGINQPFFKGIELYAPIGNLLPRIKACRF